MLSNVPTLHSTKSLPVPPIETLSLSLSSFLKRLCHEDVLSGKFESSLGILDVLDVRQLPVLTFLDQGDGAPWDELLDREFLFFRKRIRLVCLCVLCCNVMDRFCDLAGVEGVNVYFTANVLGGRDIARGRDEFVLMGAFFNMLKYITLITFGLETTSIFDLAPFACVASVES